MRTYPDRPGSRQPLIRTGKTVVDSRVSRLLQKLGLEAHFEAFKANDVDFEALGYLDDDDLKEIGLSLGHRRQ